jgi:hypothetical protein
MNEPLFTIPASNLDAIATHSIQQAVTALESGQIIYCPQYPFTLLQDEKILLSDSILHPKHKNISYDYKKDKIAGLANTSSDLSRLASSFMRRFAEYAQQLITTLIPQYQTDLIWGRTSYRPAEIKNRKTSKRKDDTRIHVDAFPATPVNGLRILRVFCNINPHHKPRIWETGESFNQVMKTFAANIPAYSPMRAKLLKWIKATKTYRTHYDHLMLHLHDQMKLDDHYQHSLKKQRIEFPAESTWIVYTDSVSHAALGGQYLLEQTFYLPISAMENASLSPLKQWESLKGNLTNGH